MAKRKMKTAKFEIGSPIEPMRLGRPKGRPTKVAKSAKPAKKTKGRAKWGSKAAARLKAQLASPLLTGKLTEGEYKLIERAAKLVKKHRGLRRPAWLKETILFIAQEEIRAAEASIPRRELPAPVPTPIEVAISTPAPVVAAPPSPIVVTTPPSFPTSVTPTSITPRGTVTPTPTQVQAVPPIIRRSVIANFAPSYASPAGTFGNAQPAPAQSADGLILEDTEPGEQSPLNGQAPAAN